MPPPAPAGLGAGEPPAGAPEGMLVGGLTAAGGGRATLLEGANTVGALTRATGVVLTMWGLLTAVTTLVLATAVGAPELGPTLTIWYCPVSVLTRR